MRMDSDRSGKAVCLVTSSVPPARGCCALVAASALAAAAASAETARPEPDRAAMRRARSAGGCVAEQGAIRRANGRPRCP